MGHGLPIRPWLPPAWSGLGLRRCFERVRDLIQQLDSHLPALPLPFGTEGFGMGLERGEEPSSEMLAFAGELDNRYPSVLNVSR